MLYLDSGSIGPAAGVAIPNIYVTLKNLFQRDSRIYGK